MKGLMNSFVPRMMKRTNHHHLVRDLDMSKEKYVSLFRKWRGAVILKPSGKVVNYRMMENRLRDIWPLEHGFELTNLEESYFIARFFSRMDYLTVLEGGP